MTGAVSMRRYPAEYERAQQCHVVDGMSWRASPDRPPERRPDSLPPPTRAFVRTTTERRPNSLPPAKHAPFPVQVRVRCRPRRRRCHGRHGRHDADGVDRVRRGVRAQRATSADRKKKNQRYVNGRESSEEARENETNATKRGRIKARRALSPASTFACSTLHRQPFPSPTPRAAVACIVE